jgi:hypothetical protein
MHVFSIDIPFKGSQSHSNMRSKVTAVSYLHSGVIETAVHVTAVSMTPLCLSQRGQWLRCACHSGVNDTAVPCAAESYSRIKTGVFRIIRENFQQSWLHSGVNNTAVHVTAVSMIPLCNQLCRFTPQPRSHIQKCFNSCIRGLGGVVWWEKTEVENLVSGFL